MVKRLLDRSSAVMTRRLILTGVAASASAALLAACGDQAVEPVGTVTRVPAEGAPPTQPPAPTAAATPGGGTPASGGTPAGGDTPAATEPAAPAADAIGTLEAIDIGYVLGDLSTLQGDEITLTVAPGTTIPFENNGAAAHDFVVDALNLRVDLPAGEAAPIEIPADAPVGEYEFYCSYAGHKAAGMVGTLVITEGAPAAEEAAPEAEAEGEAEQAAPAAAGEQTAVGPLEAIDIGYELGDLSTLRGDEITLEVTPGTTFDFTNTGAAGHDFVVDALSLRVDPPPGETLPVTIPADAAPGEYEFYCSYAGHKAAGMLGTLVIVEGAPATAAGAGEETAAPAAGTPASEDTAGGGTAASGRLEAIDIGYKLGDRSTMNGDEITLEVQPGTTFDFTNTGATAHDFVVDELELRVDAQPGDTVQVTIPEDAAPGEYRFYCSYPGHDEAGMSGTLVIGDGAAAGSPAAASPAATAESTPAAAGEGEQAAAPAPAAVGPLEAIDIGYVLGDLSTLRGDAVTLEVTPGTTFDFVNTGAAAHDFVVDALNIRVDLAPGATDVVTIPDDAAPGEYEFYCSYAGHKPAGMLGTLVVV